MLSTAGNLAAEADAFALTLKVDPPGSGSAVASPPGPYEANDVVTLTATPAAGYTFDKWVLADNSKWWDAGWDYRVEVTAAAAGYARKDKPAEFTLNFTQIWNSLGASGTLDPNSIRVVEVDGSDNVIDDNVVFQFDKATDYNASSKATGTLVLIMKGNTGQGATRRYHVYFDKTGKGFSAPNFPAQVVLSDQADEKLAAFKIVNATGTMFIHKKSGGVSSYNDANGNDWVSWNSAAGSAGADRGIPNATGGANSGLFHPGKGNMTATVLNTGPIKTTLHFLGKKISGDTQRWEGTFEIYPNYTTFTMIKTKVSPAQAYKFWFLYEGTPGGSLETGSDYVVRSDGQQNNAGQDWDYDLPGEEWVYVADPTLGRSIYLAHHEDDDKLDSYKPGTGNLMTVFGFGRSGNNLLMESASTPQHLTFSLMDEVDINDAKPIIYNAYRDLNANVGDAQARAGASLGSQNPVPFTVTGNHTITAQFKPVQYTLTVNISPGGTGTVTKSPDKPSYANGEVVTLMAAPTLGGYNFAGWQGDATGTTNPLEVTITKDTVITATFAQSFTITTSANPPEGGSVTLDPPGPSYAPGTVVTVSASANGGYTFTNWSGDLTTASPVETITVNGNLNIVANFGEPQFTFTATSAGNGTVDWTPKKAFYAPGEMVTVTPTPAQGYAFSNWSGSVASTANPLVLPILADTSVIANFVAVQQHTVTVTVPGGGGTVNRSSPGPAYPTGTTLTLTAVPSAGMRFASWGGDISGTDPVAEFVVTSDMNITAAFEVDGEPLEVIVNPPTGGSVLREPSQTHYPAGTVVTLTAVANTGWTFEGWSGAASGLDSVTTVVVPAGGTSVTASFSAPGPFTLNVVNAGTGTGSVSIVPQQTEYEFGTAVKLTAVPDIDSVFVGWSGDATGNKNPLTITMDGDKNIVANFIVPSGPFSDNFDSCSLSARWGQLINPLGDGSVRVDGRYLYLTVPAGQSHNVWSTGNDAPRVMQEADNLDFEYVVKFASQVTETAQMQGIIIEQDADNYARFDIEFNGTLKAYSATISGGKARARFAFDILNPADATYMKVTRTGNNWAMAFSGDGVNWIDAGSFKNFTLNVNKAGIFVGNVGPKNGPWPEHTAVIDYFHNLTQGPLPEERPLLEIITVGGGTVTTNPGIDQLACGQTVTLTAAPGLGWAFGSWSGDVNGTQPTTSLLLTGPKTVTATFTGSGTQYQLLPMIIKP